MSTGIYFRTQREGKFQPVLLEHLTAQERSELLGRYNQDALLTCIESLCQEIQELNPEQKYTPKQGRL